MVNAVHRLVILPWRELAEVAGPAELGACLAPLRALGYEEDVDMLVDGDAEEVRDILAAVEEAAEVKKPTTKKFKRELARLRGQGEAFA